MRTKQFSLLLAFSMSALFVSTLSFQSCNKKETDAKEVAEEQNEQVIENDTTASADSKDAREDASEFIVDAGSMDMKEVELGKLAQTKSMNADVKAHGKMMEDAHSKALAAVKTLAAAKGVALPADVSEDGKEMIADLTKKSGKDFDKAYLDAMEKGHKKAIDKFADGIKETTDPEIKAWAETTLPELQKHYDHTLDLQKKYK